MPESLIARVPEGRLNPAEAEPSAAAPGLKEKVETTHATQLSLRDKGNAGWRASRARAIWRARFKNGRVTHGSSFASRYLSSARNRLPARAVVIWLLKGCSASRRR